MTDASEVRKRSRARGESFGAGPRVEVRIHRGGRRLRGAARQEEQDDEVLRQRERLELAPVAPSELWAVDEEERHVSADPGGELVQLVRRQRAGELRVRQPQRGRSIGAAAAQTGRERDLLLDRDPPVAGRSERGQRALHDRVACEAANRGFGGRLDRDAIAQVDPLVDA